MLAFAPVWNSLSYLHLTGRCVLFPGLFAVGWCHPAEINTLHCPYQYCGYASQSVVIKDVLKYQGFNEKCHLPATMTSLKQKCLIGGIFSGSDSGERLSVFLYPLL